MVEMKEQLEVTDVKGNKIGLMNVEIAPCDDKGREYTEADDMFVDSPEDLVKKNVNFVFKILNCRGLPNKYTVKLSLTVSRKIMQLWHWGMVHERNFLYFRTCIANTKFT